MGEREQGNSALHRGTGQSQHLACSSGNKLSPQPPATPAPRLAAKLESTSHEQQQVTLKLPTAQILTDFSV